MKIRPKALDLFCCAGGASMGLHQAGFDVIGVDINPQPRYPFTFVQADALTYPLEGFDFIWASPPCQRFCALRTREDLSGYPDLIEPIRKRLIAAKVPFVIENVPGAPVRHDLMLCGGMFGLRSYRHRFFECSFLINQPAHPKHTVRVNRRGENRRAHWANGGFITITGDVGVYCGPEAMGIKWMSGNEMSEAIPPAYAKFIGKVAIKALRCSHLNTSAVNGAIIRVRDNDGTRRDGLFNRRFYPFNAFRSLLGIGANGEAPTYDGLYSGEWKHPTVSSHG